MIIRCGLLGVLGAVLLCQDNLALLTYQRPGTF